jgi:DNA processing protein
MTHHSLETLSPLCDAILWQMQCTLTLRERRHLVDGMLGPKDTALNHWIEHSSQRFRLMSQDHRAHITNPNHQLVGLHSLVLEGGKDLVQGSPLALAFRGDAGGLMRRSIAIVGSRHPSYQGRKLAHLFARDLAARGYFIWSGGAIGIDTTALMGALNAAGNTTKDAVAGAVLGSGLSEPYPASNRCLFADPRILCVSEFHALQRAQPWCFPTRNFTLAWLADYILVIESQLSSGSLITADCAAQLGRGVGAIVWPLEHPLASGNKALIETGADAILTPEDIRRLCPL